MMKEIPEGGIAKIHFKEILAQDTAIFGTVEVHPVCSTFVLAREIEWATRQIVLELLNEDEEALGTRLTIDHISPAFVGETLEIKAWTQNLKKNELLCGYLTKVKGRVIAKGETGQKIFTRSRIRQILTR